MNLKSLVCAVVCACVCACVRGFQVTQVERRWGQFGVSLHSACSRILNIRAVSRNLLCFSLGCLEAATFRLRWLTETTINQRFKSKSCIRAASRPSPWLAMFTRPWRFRPYLDIMCVFVLLLLWEQPYTSLVCDIVCSCARLSFESKG